MAPEWLCLKREDIFFLKLMNPADWPVGFLLSVCLFPSWWQDAYLQFGLAVLACAKCLFLNSYPLRTRAIFVLNEYMGKSYFYFYLTFRCLLICLSIHPTSSLVAGKHLLRRKKGILQYPARLSFRLPSFFLINCSFILLMNSLRWPLKENVLVEMEESSHGHE